MTIDQYYERYSTLTENEMIFFNSQQLNYSDYAAQFELSPEEPVFKIVQAVYQKYQEYLQVYALDYYLESQIKFRILISPCEKFSNKTLCKEGLEEQEYSDISQIIGGPQLQIAFYTDAAILHCNEEWKLLVECGTYLEIHRPFDPNVLSKIYIKEYFLEGFLFFQFPTRELCAGKYEIWIVVQSRNGKAQQFAKPFYVESPNCDCTFSSYIPQNSTECN